MIWTFPFSFPTAFCLRCDLIPLYAKRPVLSRKDRPESQNACGTTLTFTALSNMHRTSGTVHALPLTQACGPDTWRVSCQLTAFPLSLSGPFAGRPVTGIPPSPALCKRPLRFDFRLIGLLIAILIPSIRQLRISRQPGCRQRFSILDIIQVFHQMSNIF